MYNQQFQSRNQNSQRSYQPVGQVASFYGQNQQQQQFPTQGTFHASNYRGNQAGHDATWRSDSFSPAQQGNYLNNTTGQYGLNSAAGIQSSWGTGASSAQSSAQSFHNSNYHGNQLGHDAAGRSDSFSPAQYGNQFGNQFNNQFRNQLSNQISGANQISNQSGFGQSPYQNQNTGSSGGHSAWGSGNSAQSFHTANYQGNQLGHDAAQRGDSFTTSQQGYGRGTNSFANNHVSQQFGFNNAY
jgi:hypothetical protein